MPLAFCFTSCFASTSATYEPCFPTATGAAAGFGAAPAVGAVPAVGAPAPGSLWSMFVAFTLEFSIAATLGSFALSFAPAMPLSSSVEPLAASESGSFIPLALFRDFWVCATRSCVWFCSSSSASLKASDSSPWFVRSVGMLGARLPSGKSAEPKDCSCCWCFFSCSILLCASWILSRLSPSVGPLAPPGEIASPSSPTPFFVLGLLLMRSCKAILTSSLHLTI
mmetsp:Transcript_20632/g.39921  ORF Transcript_20632/g.39921 Transcript_20632/m.39921 type:complete len:224 (+) Transcript_20632:778-1449(+)